MTALLEYYSATALLEYVSSAIVQIAADSAPISL